MTPARYLARADTRATQTELAVVPWDLDRLRRSPEALLAEAEARFGCRVEGPRVVPTVEGEGPLVIEPAE